MAALRWQLIFISLRLVTGGHIFEPTSECMSDSECDRKDRSGCMCVPNEYSLILSIKCGHFTKSEDHQCYVNKCECKHECLTDNHCLGTLKNRCDTNNSEYKCVECLKNSDCAGTSMEICNMENNQCVESVSQRIDRLSDCKFDSECAREDRYGCKCAYETFHGLFSGDCGYTSRTEDHTFYLRRCECVHECLNNSHCTSASKEYCNMNSSEYKCVECFQNINCAGTSKEICNTEKNQCVESNAQRIENLEKRIKAVNPLEEHIKTLEEQVANFRKHTKNSPLNYYK